MQRCDAPSPRVDDGGRRGGGDDGVLRSRRFPWFVWCLDPSPVPKRPALVPVPSHSALAPWHPGHPALATFWDSGRGRHSSEACDDDDDDVSLSYSASIQPSIPHWRLLPFFSFHLSSFPPACLRMRTRAFCPFVPFSHPITSH
jgi:hypothetical protein